MNLLKDNIKHLKVKLASKSPRRQELLGKIIDDFEIVSKEIEEVYPENLEISSVASYLANLKAKSYKNEVHKKDGFNMLDKLSGNTHHVYTGVSLLLNEEISSFCDVTKVTFYKLKKEEINYYIDYYKPMDKAGSYGIQDWMGYVGIKKIEGDFFNVMGLPLHRLYREIEKIISKKNE
jgi:septum formation protein